MISFSGAFELAFFYIPGMVGTCGSINCGGVGRGFLVVVWHGGKQKKKLTSKIEQSYGDPLVNAFNSPTYSPYCRPSVPRISII